jgi:hypothetical protein
VADARRRSRSYVLASLLVDQEIRPHPPQLRTIQIQAGQDVITVADPIPDDVR